ncbi:related to YSA1 - sugar-nucleotide hydrolase [Ustilago sp. UG-2017b]|nr:related to YSA1 - sugar-nucleotide hydrolase [Ustilago sp. UG-2017b]
MSSQSAKVIKTAPLDDSEAKWVGLRSIEWVDPTGRQRKWESADRKTRKGDVDAVAIMTIIHRPSSEPHILLISQYRPPVGKSCIEMPAGLIDAGEEGDEGTNRAALRELEEETGYGTDKEGGKVQIEETTPTMFNDPGLTGANMKMVVVSIQLKDDSAEPVAKPEEGECIEKHLVPVKGLYKSLKDFQAKGFAVDARLAHLAIGLEVGAGKMGRL